MSVIESLGLTESASSLPVLADFAKNLDQMRHFKVVTVITDRDFGSRAVWNSRYLPLLL